MIDTDACLVATDGSVARVKIDRDLDAASIESLIEQLMACRAAMLPLRRPVMFPGGRIAVGDGVHRQEGPNGRTMLCIHHAGLGWLGAEAPEDMLTPSDSL